MTSETDGSVAPDPVQRLEGWMRERFGPDIAVQGPAETNTEGFDSEIHFLSLVGADVPEGWRRPLVLRIKPSAELSLLARRERDIQNWCADAGLPVPRVLQVLEPGDPYDRPAQVMERAPGTMLLDVVRSSPWRARSLMGDLARLHARLHSTDPEGFPPGEDLLDRRLALVRTTAEGLGHAGLRRGLEEVEALTPRLRGGPQAVCHGDFHPLNVIAGPSGLQLIDWTDAGVGDRHGDVARTLLLFDVAWLAAGSRAERVALRAVGPLLGRAYRRAYRRELELDDGRIALWTPVQLLHGWSQAVGVQDGFFTASDADGEQRVPDSLADILRARFEQALAEVT